MYPDRPQRAAALQGGECCGACRAYSSVLKRPFLAACALAPGVVTDLGAWPVAELVR